MSLLEYISQAAAGGCLPEDFSLPAPDGDADALSFAAGAMDGIALYHMGPQELDEAEKALIEKAVAAANERDFGGAEALLAELTKEKQAIFAVEPLQDYIRTHKNELKPASIFDFASGMLRNSDNRECVKLALALLELFDNEGSEALKNDIRTVALSDEFALFAIRVISRWKNGNEEIFSLAKKLKGWGRIHAVEALKPSASSIKKWLLTEAVTGDVMDSYLALTCWNKSDAEFVLKNRPSYEQLAGIGRLLRALLDEGPVPGISSMENGDQIIETFLDAAEKQPLELEDYRVIYDIYLHYKEAGEGRSWPALKSKKLLTTYRCRCMILDALKQGEAVDMAEGTGVDVKPYVMELLKSSIKEHRHLVRYIMDDEAFRREAIELYRQQLPPDSIHPGPGTALGLGEEYWRESALEFILQELRRYPLEGMDLVETALKAEPVRTRFGALNVLRHWVSLEKKPLSELLQELCPLLESLKDAEPDDDIKAGVEELLSGATSFESIGGVRKRPEFSQESLNILADAISDIGAWQWWYLDDDMLQLEFGGVQLYDDSKAEKAPHSSTAAVRFYGNIFGIFLDELEDADWDIKLHNDEIQPFPLDGFALAFNDPAHAKELMKEYPHRKPLKPRFEESLFAGAKYLISASCGEVAFIAGGDDMRVVTHNGEFTEENIEEASRRWGEYWKDYWLKRGTKEAYERDWACEATIPVSLEDSDVPEPEEP